MQDLTDIQRSGKTLYLTYLEALKFNHNPAIIFKDQDIELHHLVLCFIHSKQRQICFGT